MTRRGERQTARASLLISRGEKRDEHATLEADGRFTGGYAKRKRKEKIYVALTDGEQSSQRTRERHRRVSNAGAVYIARRALNTWRVFRVCPSTRYPLSLSLSLSLLLFLPLSETAEAARGDSSVERLRTITGMFNPRLVNSSIIAAKVATNIKDVST
jgi:hypothetical protein